MSRRSPHLCAEPGCPAVLPDGPGRCHEHRPPSGWAAYNASGRRPDYGGRWRRLRNAYLAAHPRCERCGAPGEHVHHTDRDPARFLDWASLEALCARCHRAETSSHGLGRQRRKRKGGGRTPVEVA